MEQKTNEKTIKKAVWLLVGIPVAVVLIMFGILIYNNYLHEKELEEIKTEEQNINLTGYTELDITNSNIDYLFDYTEDNGMEKFTLLDGSTCTFEIKNNKLYIKVNGTAKEINVANPKKVTIKPTDSPEIKGYVLTTEGELYYIYADYLATDVSKDNINTVINNNVSKMNSISKATDISWITPKHNTFYGADVSYLVVTINEKEYVLDYEEELINLSNFSYADWLNNDGSIKDKILNGDNIIVKVVLSDSWDKKYFLDKDNYLYSIADENMLKISNTKVSKVYYNNSNFKVIYKDNSTADFDIPEEGLITN